MGRCLELKVWKTKHKRSDLSCYNNAIRQSKVTTKRERQRLASCFTRCCFRCLALTLHYNLEDIVLVSSSDVINNISSYCILFSAANGANGNARSGSLKQRPLIESSNPKSWSRCCQYIGIQRVSGIANSVP